MKNGYGRYIWENGISFEGQFVKDEIQGYGTRTFPSGQKQDGHFKNGKFLGK
jgi:hypothetical protein